MLIVSSAPRAQSRLLAKARASAERVADDVRGVEQRMNSHFSEASLRSLEQSSQTGLSAAAVAVATSAAQPVAELSEDALRRHAAASGTASAADAAPVDADQLSNASSLSSLFSVHSETPPPPLVLARFVPLRCLLLQLDRACRFARARYFICFSPCVVHSPHARLGVFSSSSRSSLLSNHLMDVIEVLHAIESDARRENRRRLKALERAERKLSGAFAADEDADTDDSSVDGDDDEEGSDPLSLSLSGFDSRPSEFGRDEAAGAHFGVLPSWLTAAQIQIILKQTHLQVENEDQVRVAARCPSPRFFSVAVIHRASSALPYAAPLVCAPRCSKSLPSLLCISPRRTATRPTFSAAPPTMPRSARRHRANRSCSSRARTLRAPRRTWSSSLR